ncbi:hypothetical protein VN97_g983 [Penicillium thymicola]|uniref:Uncharacterized protein n=1 Tax=Penicillium thymicola TaxID=293382 RepID=A0AAI9XDM3_PENTH|nr:hypothetical protein VN97_g983 [Penicillium thymicola]
MCPLLFNVQLYAIASRFEVEYLKLQTKLTFVTLAQDHWDKDEFLTAACEVYKTTPNSDRGLRDVVVAVCQKYRRELREKKAFEKLVQETPGLATDIVLLSHRWLPQSASTRPHLSESHSLFLSTLQCGDRIGCGFQNERGHGRYSITRPDS